jgi:adenylate kinase family enzyme
MRRIHVIGTSGSGKTTLAANIAHRLKIPHIELDSLHWEADWQSAPLDVFRRRVSRALEGDSWTIDGNYSKVRDIVWARADTIVWLDYPLGVILWQLFKRTAKRVLTQEELWGGNTETWQDQLLSKNSILLWAVKTYKRRRKEYPHLLSLPDYSHLKLIQLESQAATRTWLLQLSNIAEIPSSIQNKAYKGGIS